MVWKDSVRQQIAETLNWQRYMSFLTNINKASVTMHSAPLMYMLRQECKIVEKLAADVLFNIFVSLSC